MSEYTLRPWRDGDDLELMQLWPDAENVQASVFRAKLGPDADQPWQRSVVAEHQGIIDALASGDEERSKQAIRSHLLRTATRHARA